MGSMCWTWRTGEFPPSIAGESIAVRRELRSELTPEVSITLGPRRLVLSPAAPGFSGSMGGSAGIGSIGAASLSSRLAGAFRG